MRFKLLINIILSLIFSYSLYASVNYLILFFENPVLKGSQNYYFMGNMMLFIPFVILSVVSAVMLILTNRKRKNKNLK